MFLFFKTQKRHHTVSENIQSNVLFKVLITNASPCGYINAISEKHLRYSLFVKRIIAMEHNFTWSDYSYVHLCKQFCHIKITLKVFSLLIPSPQKSSNLTSFLPYHCYSNASICFSPKDDITDFHVRNAFNKIWHPAKRKGRDTFQTMPLKSKK